MFELLNKLSLSFIRLNRFGIDIVLSDDLILPIKWYGLSYLIAYFTIKALVKSRLKQIGSNKDKSIEMLGEVVLLSGIIGGRLWYLIIRYFEFGIPVYVSAFKIWEGGMAFQGGLLFGITSGLLWVYFTEKKYISLFSDIVLSFLPLGIFIGRLGNYLNAEFMYEVTSFSLPACLFASIVEGIIPFILLQLIWYSTKYRPYNISLTFGLFYGIARFVTDLFRTEPVYFWGLKLSQINCSIIILFSCITLLLRNAWFKQKHKLVRLQ